MTRVSFEGVTLDTRTRDMFIRLRWKLELPLVLTQGSYSNVAASAGTHSGGGALDIRARDLTDTERKRVELGARQLGFAAWLRTPQQGDWPYHIHGIAIGCPDMSPAAADQVVAYKRGRNGLANNGPDTGPGGYRDMTWEKYEAAHPDEEWLMTTGDEILTAVNAEADRNQNREVVYANRYKDIKGDIAELKTQVDELKAQVAAIPKA